MAGSNLKAWQIQTGTTVGDIPVLEDVGGGTAGFPSVDASQVLSLSFTQLIDSIADSQVPQSAVTQHEDALAIDLPQLTQGGATDAQVLTWNNTAGEWEPQTPQANVSDWIVVSSATTASADDKILADTSGGAFTITLPGSPATGNQLIFADIDSNWATNNLTVDGNGNNIEGASTFTGDVDQGSFYVIYNGTQWIVRFGTGV